MNSDPIIELNDGINMSMGGGIRMQIEYPDNWLVDSTRRPSPIHIRLPWYSRLWTFLNLDIRDIYRTYIRPIWR